MKKLKVRVRIFGFEKVKVRAKGIKLHYNTLITKYLGDIIKEGEMDRMYGMHETVKTHKMLFVREIKGKRPFKDLGINDMKLLQKISTVF